MKKKKKRSRIRHIVWKAGYNLHRFWFGYSDTHVGRRGEVLVVDRGAWRDLKYWIRRKTKILWRWVWAAVGTVAIAAVTWLVVHYLSTHVK